MEISFRESYTESLAELAPATYKRINRFIKKIHHDPKSPGLHIEPIDNGFVSIRASQKIRVIGILCGEKIVLCYVAGHDEAYAWANKHRALARYIGKTISYDISDQVEISEPEGTEAVETDDTYQYGRDIAKKLLQAGVESYLASSLETCRDDNELYGRLDTMPQNIQYQILGALDGETASISTPKAKSKPSPPTQNDGDQSHGDSEVPSVVTHVDVQTADDTPTSLISSLPISASDDSSASAKEPTASRKDDAPLLIPEPLEIAEPDYSTTLSVANAPLITDSPENPDLPKWEQSHATVYTAYRGAFAEGQGYTKSEIGVALDCQIFGYLPHKNGRVVCATVTRAYNPDAPDVILPGFGPEIEYWGDVFCRQGDAIPTFIKRNATLWDYVGDYRVSRWSTDSADIAEHSARSRRDNVSKVIFLERQAPT